MLLINFSRDPSELRGHATRVSNACTDDGDTLYSSQMNPCELNSFHDTSNWIYIFLFYHAASLVKKTRTMPNTMLTESHVTAWGQGISSHGIDINFLLDYSVCCHWCRQSWITKTLGFPWEYMCRNGTPNPRLPRRCIDFILGIHSHDTDVTYRGKYCTSDIRGVGLPRGTIGTPLSSKSVKWQRDDKYL